MYWLLGGRGKVQDRLTVCYITSLLAAVCFLVWYAVLETYNMNKICHAWKPYLINVQAIWVQQEQSKDTGSAV